MTELSNTIETGRTARKQVPAIAKMIAARLYPNTVNLDIGSGPYSDFSDWLNSRGVCNLPVDLEHATSLGQDIDEQILWLDTWRGLGGWIDTITISNVLNVIKDDVDLLSTLRFAADYAKERTRVYVTVYEGDRSGEGRQTRDGYQRNEKLATYMGVCGDVFHRVEKRGNLLTLTDPVRG